MRIDTQKIKDICWLLFIGGLVAIGVGGFFLIGALTRPAVIVTTTMIVLGAIVASVGGLPLLWVWLTEGITPDQDEWD